jgi:flagellar hook-basal body complex protein FliE
MANPTVIKLQDGNVMPQLGLGVWQASNEEVITAIQKALEVGDESVNLHDVMISLQKASLSFQTMVQVRNKLVTAYQEIMNTQV